MKVFLHELGKPCMSTRCLLSILTMLIALIIDNVQVVYTDISAGIALPFGTHQALLLQTAGSEAIMLSAPILCAIPYASAFVDEIKSGFTRHCLSRIKAGDYIRNKIGSCAVAGGLVLFLGLLLGWALFTLALLPLEEIPLADDVQSQNIEIVAQALIFFLNGSLWASVGMCMSVVTMNKYMALASPFILFYVLVIIGERYFRTFYVLNPKNWLIGDEAWFAGAWGCILFLTLWNFVVMLACYFIADRRLRSV